MRWQIGRRSENVEDRRGSRISAPVVGGGIGAVILSLVVALLGGDPSVIWQQDGTQSDRPTTESPQTKAQDQMADFVSVVLADTEDT